MHVIHTSSLVLYVCTSIIIGIYHLSRHTRLNMWPSEAPSASARELSLAAALSQDPSPTVLTLTNGLTADDGDNFSVRISNVRSLRTLFI